MKTNQAKGFTFKVADKKENQVQAKTRDGVATAGCTRVTTPWGFTEWAMTNPYNHQKDEGYYC